MRENPDRRLLARFWQHADELKVTGIDIFTGRGQGSDDDADEEEQGEGIEEYEKIQYNLNASFRGSGLRPQSFHLINTRMLADGINANRWPSFVQELCQLLRPGGWLQMVEIFPLFQSDSGMDAPFLERWWTLYQQSLGTHGKNARVGQDLSRLMLSARFEQVYATSRKLPIGPWNTGMSTYDLTLS